MTYHADTAADGQTTPVGVEAVRGAEVLAFPKRGQKAVYRWEIDSAYSPSEGDGEAWQIVGYVDF